ncbi:MAG TPA: LPS assembly lipoprotein LptE [Arenimonas sp.]|nr:LPS assembly lipoprotein LptE [Arenimonas sp.]
MRRFLVLLSVLLLATACGFRPRGSLDLGHDLGPLRVQASDPYSPLAADLGNALRRAGVELADAEDKAAAVLRLSGERLRTRPLSVDRSARVREYEVTYRVDFELRDAGGAVRVPRQRVEISRDFTYDSGASIGTPAEQELIETELRRDVQAAILRRLDAALRTD